jgi:hypothetical protein
MPFSSIDSTQEELGIPTTATKGSETDWKAKCEELEESHKRAIEEVKLKTKSAVTERSKLMAELTDVSQRAQPKESPALRARTWDTMHARPSVRVARVGVGGWACPWAVFSPCSRVSDWQVKRSLEILQVRAKQGPQPQAAVSAQQTSGGTSLVRIALVGLVCAIVGSLLGTVFR